MRKCSRCHWNHQTVRYLHDLGGGLVLTLPLESDLRNPESGQYIRKYLHTKKGVDVENRMRVYNMIRDLTADSYGGWRSSLHCKRVAAYRRSARC